MVDPLIFMSRSPRYKLPYGAVPSGTVVRFTLRPLRSDGFSHATLCARFESRPEDKIEKIFLPWTDLEDGRDLFCGVLPTADYIGLIWYSFRLEGLDGRFLELDERQLTVYDGQEAVPAWFGAGMSYQIFPDRFCRTQIPDPTGLVGARWVHGDWTDAPVYRPDAQGEVRNRDFFGGNLPGIRAKLPYLQALGVETLYLTPIFEAAENHRYGTGDYEKIDPMLGTNDDFSALCADARARGMRVLLDGVFNHTGFVSKYFDGDGSYADRSIGAARSQKSPYYPWYHFRRWPDQYDAWWGIYSLPAVNESDPTYLDYIIRGENSIVRRWLRAGASGWRLDVADELPDTFIAALHAAVRETTPDGVVIGEVWEDGSTKIAYGERRKHLLGGHCDGLMNYPFRNALLAYLQGGDAADFAEKMEILRENYPPFAFYSAMNALSTHDTPRILTLLGVGADCMAETRDWRAHYRLTPEERARGVALLRLGALVLFAFPGSPTVYYGDEAGMEGFEDPFNRGTFPWGDEDAALTAYFAALGQLRKTQTPLRDGAIAYLRAEGAILAFTRSNADGTLLAAVNAGATPGYVRVPWTAEDLLAPGTYPLRTDTGYATVPLAPYSGKLLRRLP